jgi:lactoylglutathione lyase
MTSQSMTHEPPPAGLNAFRPRILYTSYFVADIEKSLEFYRDVLGMREQQRIDLGGGTHEAVLSFPESKGAGLILMWDTLRGKPYQHGDGYSRFVLLVSDLEAAVEHLRAQGIALSSDPIEAGAMRYCFITDPDDYRIELLQIKR